MQTFFIFRLLSILMQIFSNYLQSNNILYLGAELNKVFNHQFKNQKLKMGMTNICGENIFQKLVSEYGDDFLKLVVAEKSKDVVKEKFTQINHKSNEKFDDFEDQTTFIIDQKSDELNKVFESAKNSIDSTIPGGIATVQRVKGESINEFSGFNKLQSSIDNIKDQTFMKLNSKRDEVNNELTSKKKQMINKIQDERPKVPIYEQLPDIAKKQILKKGEQKFEDHVLDNKEKIGKQALSQFSPEMLTSFFNDINPENPLEGIVGNAFGILTGNMSGSSGGIGGFIKGIF